MKTHRTLIAFTVSWSIAVGMFSIASGQGALDRSAKIVRMKGFARYTTGNFVWQPIKVGDVLRPGTVIQTSADDGSFVDLVFQDGQATLPQPVTYRPSIPDSLAPSGTSFQPTSERNVVRIWGDSALGIDKLTAMETGTDLVTETQLDLKRGRITGNVKKLSAASKYEIKLPNGVAGVRGTLFDIQAVGIVKVYIGSMIVAWVDPRTQNVTTQVVNGGQSYDAPSHLVSLLSTESMYEFEEISLRLSEVQTIPTLMPVASDHTVIGMSPVGAEPGTIRSVPLDAAGPGR